MGDILKAAAVGASVRPTSAAAESPIHDFTPEQLRQLYRSLLLPTLRELLAY